MNEFERHIEKCEEWRKEMFSKEMLNRGLKGRIWFWLKKREIMKDENFVNDVQTLKMLFGGHDMIANPELICYSNDGKMITDKMDFLRLDERHFLNTLDDMVISFMREGE